MENSNEYKYKRAKERVSAIKSFYSHLTVYLIVIPFLAFINYMTVDFPWVLFPAVGWGIGLFGHWVGTFGYNVILGKNWEERKIKEFMDNGEI